MARRVIVVDASAAVEVLLGSPRGTRVARHWAGQRTVAPELLDVEVCSAVARLQRAGEVAPDVAGTAVRRLASLPVARVGHALLVPDAWAGRDALRIADAFYVALARLLGVPLLTCDGRLARAPVADVVVALVR